MSTMEQARNVLRDRFGLNEYRSGQQEVIERLLAGRSAAAIFPTGGGKSLCYQLPALLLPGLTVVVSPLIALMKDQITSLARRGIDAVRLDSSLTPDEFRSAMERIRSGSAKMLFVAPERFFNERFRESLAGTPISLFAVDEAHCISQWGHNFRPDYLKLGPLARQYNAERILALTATATPAVLEDICRGLSIAPDDAIRTPFFRPNLQLRFQVQSAAQRDETLERLIKERPSGPTLVYVTLQHTAEELAEKLQQAQLPARAYHAGLNDDLRNQIQEWFMDSADPIVVATIAFGMGIDKANIRYVYHYNPPKSLESYAQEIGRAGRDGDDAICETLLVPEDRVVLDNFIFGDTPTLGSIGKLLERLAGQPERFHVSYYRLSSECDIRQLVLRTLLTYLELEGYLEATGPRYDAYQFKPRVSSAQILEHFTGERREFATQVLASAERRKVWLHLDPLRVANRLKCDRSRIVKMLEYLNEKGWIELEASDLVYGYRYVKRIEDPPALAEAMHQRVLERETAELQRVDQTFDLALLSRCQAVALSAHFGEHLDQPCGRCSACMNEPRVIPGGGSAGRTGTGRALGSSVFTGLAPLVRQFPMALGDSRQAARFLCGLSSPALVTSKLTRNGLFGCCDRIPFSDVLEACEQRV